MLKIIPILIVYNRVINVFSSMRYYFLFVSFLLLGFLLPRSLKAFSPIEQQDFVVITDPMLGSYAIEKTLVPVRKYVDFLNAVAATKDLHGLYHHEMQSLIFYHPQGWFNKAYYSAVLGQADHSIIYVAVEDVIRFYNWEEWGEPTAEEVAMIGPQIVTESGAYFFHDEVDNKSSVTANSDASYALPSQDQLTASIHQIKVSNFYEWTSSRVIVDTPDDDEEESALFNIALLDDPFSQEFQFMNEDNFNRDVQIGFRLMIRNMISTQESTLIDSSLAASKVASSSPPSPKNHKIFSAQDNTKYKGSISGVIALCVLCLLILFSLLAMIILGPLYVLELIAILSQLTLRLAEWELDFGIVAAIDAQTSSAFSFILLNTPTPLSELARSMP